MKTNKKISDVSIKMKLFEESYESNPGSVNKSDNNSKGEHIQARTLESTFERRTTSSSKDATTPTSKNSSISEEEEEIVLPTTVVPPSVSKDPKKTLKKNQKNIRNDKPTDNFKPNDTPIPNISSYHPPTSTPPSGRKRVAKVTNVNHLADITYDILTVIVPRDATEDNDLLTLSNI